MKLASLFLALVATMATGYSCSRPETGPGDLPDPARDIPPPEQAGTRTAVLAGGCFWCLEAAFEQLPGVEKVVSGYAGGTEETARYGTVAAGESDHAESVRVTYDPAKISYGRLLKVFFTLHDPTTLNRQGPDSGRQYRSTIFYDGEEQRAVAEAYIRQLGEAGVFPRAIVTTLEPLDRFYPAEASHQDFVRRNPDHPYVRVNALPKVEKVKRKFSDLPE